MNTPGQVVKELRAAFLKRMQLPNASDEDTRTLNFVVASFDAAAVDCLIEAYEPETPKMNALESRLAVANSAADIKKALRIEKARITREKNKLKKAQRRAKRDARRFPKVSADPIVRMQVSEPELVEV